MKVYIMGSNCFVDIGDKKGQYMLCIGTKEEVDNADEAKVLEMVQEAVVWSKYRAIADSKGHSVN